MEKDLKDTLDHLQNLINQMIALFGGALLECTADPIQDGMRSLEYAATLHEHTMDGILQLIDKRHAYKLLLNKSNLSQADIIKFHNDNEEIMKKIVKKNILIGKEVMSRILNMKNKGLKYWNSMVVALYSLIGEETNFDILEKTPDKIQLLLDESLEKFNEYWKTTWFDFFDERPIFKDDLDSNDIEAGFNFIVEYGLVDDRKNK